MFRCTVLYVAITYLDFILDEKMIAVWLKRRIGSGQALYIVCSWFDFVADFPLALLLVTLTPPACKHHRTLRVPF